MAQKPLNYTFVYADACNMCGGSDFKVLGKRLNTSQGLRPRRKLGITTTVCKCKSCGLIFANPMPIPHNWDDHYGVPPEEYWHDYYFEEDPKLFATEIAVFQRLRGITPGKTALDVGAGIGKVMRSLMRVGFDTWGVEPSAPFRQRAIDKMGIAPDRMLLKTAEELEFAPGTFDLITLGVVLEHLVDPAAVLARMLPLLKPEGLLHIEVPSNRWTVARIFDAWFRLVGTDYTSHLSPMHTPYHLYEFDVRSFEANARRLGYGIAHHEFFVCDTFLPKALDPILKPWMAANNTGMQLSIWLQPKP
jgi:SAM-dependent methyltransferase